MVSNVIYYGSIFSSVFARIIPMYCFLMVSTQFNTFILDVEQKLLANAGMNFRTLFLGEWIFRICYIYVCLLINIALYWFVLLNLSKDADAVFLSFFYWLAVASLFFVINYSLSTLTILAIVKSK